MKAQILVAALAALCQSTSAFSKLDMQSKRVDHISLDASKSSTSHGGDTRRDFFAKTTSAAVAATSGLGQGVLAPLPAYAANADKVNAKLRK